MKTIMKLTFLTLFTTTISADNHITVDPNLLPSVKDPSDWNICTSGADCKGSYICCSLTETKKGAELKAPTKICTNLFDNGVVPDKDDLDTSYKGYKYFCSKEDHEDPTNPKGNTIVPADGSGMLVVGATSAAISAFLFA